MPKYELKDELARYCLPSANRDPNRKLAWVNSICILFLAIGLVGAKPAKISMKPLPLIDEAIPTIIEQLPPPPQTAQEQNQEQADEEKTETPQVVIVTPNAPNINFEVPTIGNLMVPNAVATAPPLNPLQPAAPLKRAPSVLNNTGAGGERPQPAYPRIALEQAQQGTVVLLLTVDEAGIISSIEVKESSGYPVLDRSALEFVKRHWIIPPGNGNRTFEAPITYKLQQN
jgi:protein TonB